MLNIFKKLTDDDLEQENRLLRKYKKTTEKEYVVLKDDYDDLLKKYTALLEEKGEGFNQFLKYLGLYEEYYNLAKENKKEIAELKADIRRESNVIEEKDAEIQSKDDAIAKLERKIKRLEKKVEVKENESTEICEEEYNSTSETDKQTE